MRGEPQFQRRVGYVKWGMMLGLGAAFGLLLWVLGTREMLALLQQPAPASVPGRPPSATEIPPS